ncbi:kinesin-like protein KIF14 isoform X2 [Brienomyrus brachyistius]|uniref:kinesin-like protein KIF14 isoform X2 n=1 Tax=Brienomyrus brachyistius TaxID=42636 RepID=UPI0020B270CA|nr:kinesin-like protein KIF14 isoform X2 [Brienomyrus brachyistius]
MEVQKGQEPSCAGLTRQINTTYVISTRCGGQKGTPGNRERLTLQRRKIEAKGAQASAKSAQENSENDCEGAVKRLSLQRRTRTVPGGRNALNAGKGAEKPASRAPSATPSKVLSEPNCRTPRGIVSLKDPGFKSKGKDGIGAEETPGKGPDGSSGSLQQRAVTQALGDTAGTRKTGDQRKVCSTPNRRTQFEKVSLKKDLFERLAGRDVPVVVSGKSTNAERQKIPGRCVKAVAQSSAQSGNIGADSRIGNLKSSVQPAPVKRGATPALSGQSKDDGPARCVASAGARVSVVSTGADALPKQEPGKLENSAVTVAVRLRPFSSREKNEKVQQVVFMKDQETVVQHPDSRQCYSFTFDFSFCSVDKSKPDFSSQQTIYEKLARPLLERAFEGYNTCLFAYGQTGSGKSYTMMGFDEETGVIPRFCEEVFSRITNSENTQVSCHLEMSYFEVYNEKIHDLLVVKDEQNGKKLPLRVREHPVYGPYVADLSANVVSSYTDVQSWLELGNKQRATAATGMNDKSSRSHSVFTLVMTQTKRELVEEEEHDHRITSRINLVDLAGSERCSSAQTWGDRLREGASINKSLLTLGKVISALSEQFQTRKRVFIPYRESVLTWLLKESLGGNSKTAMIATVSPAGSNVEESLSTLRYAKQARMIINVAKVNEDNSAKLIRELKAEVEKLRAAQMSSQGIEPERMRLFQQEIAALKMQLMQQEKDMAEAHRTWNEKLEQAEKRKREETKELQKAGITFKVDNQLPNLVNLNEDPQLSEMLLYMIKEGQTKVGKRKAESAHDIQLTGALIADEHCVISSVSGTVGITPIKDAKTFVNGDLISQTTILHHGDRVILGGDHYFRFNHPVEVHSGKRVSCWTEAGDGHKDFEFAKNELLASQRAQLEAEIEEARLKAQEDMMHGIQAAKDVAQKELSDQKMLYESKISALERELEEENQRKKYQELDNRRVVSKMEELQNAKVLLEQELHVNRRRIQLEAQATRQAMADHDVRHAKIIAALEAEKRKIAVDLERLQKKRQLKEHHAPKKCSPALTSKEVTEYVGQPQWDAMKLSVMIEEANTISRNLRKKTVFSRHEPPDNDGETDPQIQVQNAKLGISTFWSLEKFQSKLAAMRELEQGYGAKDDDVFYDPNDTWEQDLSTTSSSSVFSRRRSRSLLKSRRISGRLYEIRVHPIQALNSSPHAGLMGVNKPSSLHYSAPTSALAGICKDLIGSSVAQLLACHGAEKSAADKLASDLLAVHAALESISDLYETLGEDSHENLLASSGEAQAHLVKATSAMERAVSVTLLWVSSIKPNSSSVLQTSDKLKAEVKKMGGYFQLLIQGCDSEISSMVTEARSKTGRCLNVALRLIAHLSAVTGMEFHTTEAGSESADKCSPLTPVYEGTCIGIEHLLQDGITQAKEMQRDARLMTPRTQVLQDVQSGILEVSSSLQRYFAFSGTQNTAIDVDRPFEQPDLLWSRNKAVNLFRLNLAVKQICPSLAQILRVKENDSNIIGWREVICSSSRTILDAINGLHKDQGPVSTIGSMQRSAGHAAEARDTVHAAMRSLLAAFEPPCDKTVPSADETGFLETAERAADRNEDASAKGGTRMNRTVRKMVYTLSSEASLSASDVRWV